MEAEASAPITVLAGRYRLTAEVGRGGMATVYLATDEKHGRKVAVKVFRGDVAAAVGADRFLREIQVTAALNHPHILPLLDSGEADGLLYYVMPYVAGGSLRRLLIGGEGIPMEALLRIVREVASALDHAHAQGVVHRDIKPENILFNAGIAVVADFGVARAASLAPREHMTRTGVAVGTLGYMSPEQAIGSGEVDARTDVFSLGCVTYEMLAGGTPASWPLPDDVRLGRLTDVPPAHRARLDELPGRVEQVLARALALRPLDRFATAGEMVAALVAASERTPALSEEQVRRLLDRAAELQAREPLDAGSLTMGAIEQVAAQVGIPPEHVRQAAQELSVPGSRAMIGATPAHAPVPRAPLFPAERWDHAVLARIVQGEIPDSVFPAMAEEIQGALGIEGHSSVLTGSLTWSPATQSEDARRIVVSVRVKDGGTQVVVHEEFGPFGWRRVLIPAGIVLGALVGMGVGVVTGIGPAGMVLGVAVGLPTAIYGTVWADKQNRRPKLEELADRLAELAADATRRK
ncbi:MAG TPA: serine/threonine-protein kinase [Longimicrobiales bacterium]|nr:serine/threonine-protein kinase [Longimicrobiales bacterium]